MRGKSEGRRRLYERVAQELSGSIARGEYALGVRLPSERDLAQRFSVSRPTIRDAILALEIDGLVEVRLGSGVYVTRAVPSSGEVGQIDVGPFELIEARRAIEGEVCALAAPRIDDVRLAKLESIIGEMERKHTADPDMGDDADRRFHMLIAEATENASLVSAVEALWDARERSPQSRLLTVKARVAGVSPTVDEHRKILAALRSRDATSAREAMRDHLSRVFDLLLTLTEVEEIERARAKTVQHRVRYALGSNLR